MDFLSAPYQFLVQRFHYVESRQVLKEFLRTFCRVYYSFLSVLIQASVTLSEDSPLRKVLRTRAGSPGHASLPLPLLLLLLIIIIMIMIMIMIMIIMMVVNIIIASL